MLFVAAPQPQLSILFFPALANQLFLHSKGENYALCVNLIQLYTRIRASTGRGKTPYNWLIMADSVDLGKCFEIINNLTSEAGRVSVDS